MHSTNRRHSTTRRLLGTTAATAVAAGLLTTGLTTGAGPAAAAATCASACIQDLAVFGTPHGAVFDFDTSTLTRVQVVVTDGNGGPTHVLKDDGAWNSVYHVVADDPAYFQSGRVYDYDVLATDTSGSTWYAEGELATLTASATVHWTLLHIVKDGDSVGPGDFYGFSRCGFGPYWTHGMPESSGIFNEYHLSDGADQPLGTSDQCDAPVGGTVEVQSALADDDMPEPNITEKWWEPSDPYSWGQWSDSLADSAYTHVTVADPLSPTTVGTGDAPFSVTSPTHDNEGYAAGMRYQVLGHVTFTHTSPAVTLEPATTGPAVLEPHITRNGEDDSAEITFRSDAWPQVAGAEAHRVQWRKHGDATWQSVDLADPTMDSYVLNGLRLGTDYDFQVSRVLPGGVVALTSAFSYHTPGATPQATTVTGWPTKTMNIPADQTTTIPVQVSDDNDIRTIEVQRLDPVTTTWKTVQTATSGFDGAATIAIPNTVGSSTWRLHVLATPAFDEVTTPARVFATKTVVTGFDTAKVTVAPGTKINDTIKVTPGAYRTVFLTYRKTGTTAWTLATTLTTKANGAVTLPIVAKKGSYDWQAVVPEDTHQGNATTSAVRTVVGS